MKRGIAKPSFSALFPQFESCRFFCSYKFLETLCSSSASPLLFFFRHCCTVCINLFLRELSNQFPDDIILLCCDGTAWHESKTLERP